jgi:acetyl esterase/lipase
MTESLPLWPDGIPAVGTDPARTDDAKRAFVPTLTPVCTHQAPHPAVIVLPGGGYHVHAPHEAEPVAEWLGALGMSTFVCRYRVYPSRHPGPLADAQRALRLVRSRAADWGVDPTRVAVLGFSAGGHLAGTVSCLGGGPSPDHPDVVERENGRPDAAVLCYPVISFQPWGHQGSRQALIGQDASESLVRDLSLENAVSERTCPTFLWHTADDASVSVHNSLHYAAALRRFGVPFALHVYPTGRHGLGMAPDDAHVGRWTAACADWFRSLGWIS